MWTSWFERGVWSHPLARNVAWPDLAERLTEHRPAPDLGWCCPKCTRPPRLRFPGRCNTCGAALATDKRSLPAWSPWVYRGERRGVALATATCCLCIDYDKDVTLEDARTTWAPWEHVGHTSWSHTAEAPRVRVVLPMANTVGVASGGGAVCFNGRLMPEGLLTPAQACAAAGLRDSAYAASSWAQVWRWAWERDPRADPKVGDPGRLWYLPAARAEHPHHAWRHPGPVLDVDALHLPAEPSRRTSPDASQPGHRDASRSAQGDGWFGGLPPRRWNRDPDARRAFGLQLGGAVAGSGSQERIVGVTCPNCDEPSLWWWVTPREWAGAGCSHRRSCGYTAWLDALAQVAA